MACTSTICSCSGSRCPRAAGVTGTLGFTTPGCCKLPCPKMPLVMVSFCLQINQSTCAIIQQGCLLEREGDSCNVAYSFGATEDSWGRKCRVIHFQRLVPRDSFIRIRLCACSSCGSTCNDGSLEDNKLINFIVDGVDVRPLIVDAAAEETGSIGCVYAGCVDSPQCCTQEGWNIDSLTYGTEIVVGPLGSDLGA